MVEDELAAGIGGRHPEDGLAVIATRDQLPAAVDGDWAANVADVGGEEERRRDDRLGGVEGIGQRGEVVLGTGPAHPGAAQQLELPFVEIEPAVLRQQLPHRQVAQPHRGVA